MLLKRINHYAKAVLTGLGAAGVAVVTYAPNAENEVGLILGLAGAFGLALAVAVKKNGPKAS